MFCSCLIKGDVVVELEPEGYNSDNSISFYSSLATIDSEDGIYQEIPASCLSPNDAVSISFKIKLVDSNGSPVACNPNQRFFGLDSCPYVRIQLQSTFDDGSKLTSYPTVFGIDQWNLGEWNDFYGKFIIPPEHSNPSRFRPIIVFGANIPQDERIVVVDDVVVVKDNTITSAPTPACKDYNMGENGDAESGSIWPYGNQ